MSSPSSPTTPTSPTQPVPATHITVDHLNFVIRITVSDVPMGAGYVVPNTDAERHDDGTWHYNKVEHNGHVINFWRFKLGHYLAEKLGLDTGKFWRVYPPAGYVLFTTHKSTSVEDPGDVRRDRYLKGVHRFRSPNEFIPHMLWLAYTGGVDITNPCQCKYCSNRPQKVINEQFGLASEEDTKPIRPPPGTKLINDTGRRGIQTMHIGAGKGRGRGRGRGVKSVRGVERGEGGSKGVIGRFAKLQLQE